MSEEYVKCIDYIESLLESVNCNSFICCGDFNTSFERANAQTECLTSFMERNNLTLSWNNPVSKKEFTYTNLALNHFSCIDHFITTHNIFDCIIDNVVIYDAQNSSSQNIVYFCIGVSNFKHMIDSKCNSSHIPNSNWSKAGVEHIEQYQFKLNNSLSLIDVNMPAINCHNWHCECAEHKNEINLLCSKLINSCIDASHETIPRKRHIGKDVPGWDELVKPERDRSLFWHWMWQEEG